MPEPLSIRTITLLAALLLPSAAQAQIPTAGLQLWLRSDAGITATGGEVDQWTDQSGAQHAFVQSGATRPTLQIDDAGKPLLRFQGGQFLTGSLPFTLQQATILALFRYRGPTSNNYVYAFGASGSSGSQMCLSRRSGGAAYHYDGRRQNISGNIPQSKWVVSTQLFGQGVAGAHELRIDGVTQITSSTGSYSANFATARIGNWTSGSFAHLGDVAQIIIYDRVLSPAEISATESWLQSRTSGSSTLTYGTGCPSSVGIPALAAASGSSPRLGSTLTTETGNCPAGISVLTLFGTSDTSYQGTLPLPVSLTSLGLPSCTLYVSGDLVLPAANSGSGTAVGSFPIPNDPALAKSCFHLQSVLLDPNANFRGIALSNALTATIDA